MFCDHWASVTLHIAQSLSPDGGNTKEFSLGKCWLFS